MGAAGEREGFQISLYTAIQSGSFGFLAFVVIDSASLQKEQSASSQVGLYRNFTHDTKYLMYFGFISLNQDLKT